ncbi:hypothetical protein LCGC14_1319110 [marine sediment metagenome]|uniref:Uncharacterized protein n=1 Tax=marine sediment metagenome TaxID=412755 RepID=A0A0F9N0U4_9ZZZZ
MRAFELFEKKSEMEVLKANKIPLDDKERDKVMKAGAVWHHGPGGKESPAVWKSKNSSGKIKYVCNTHRMYQVRDTLSAAIKAYDKVKTSA